MVLSPIVKFQVKLQAMVQATGQQKRLREIAALFFKLGCIGFGGPAVHIAMMEREVVEKKKWISHELFLDLVGATNLIPGPNSTEMTMHCGHERGGWKGLIVAGVCFIIPAVIITALFAWAYQRYGRLPEVVPFLYGIKAAIIAVIFSAMITLGKKAFKNIPLWILGVICAGAVLIGANEILVLFGAGLLAVVVHLAKRNGSANSVIPFAIAIPSWKIFWIFLKIGSILYGSGYVLFAFLDAELVNKGIISKQVLIDAIAVGQFTPGPVFSAATFIGWQISGLPGAIAATIGIFLPSFLFIALLKPLIPKLRQSLTMSAFLDAVNVASIAIILAVCIEMAKEAVHDWRSIAIAVTSVVVTILWKRLNTAFIVIGGALLGYLLSII